MSIKNDLKKQKLDDDKKYNRAKIWQLFCFSCNNLSTNLPYMIISFYLLFYAQNYLLLSAVIVGWVITGMRIFDGITDPLIGFLIDKTDTKFGKFRPWMVVGNIIINVTFIMMFTMVNTEWSATVKLLTFVGFYVIHIIGYTMQTAATKGGGTVITSDPQQRPLLGAFYGALSMIFAMLFMSYIPLLAQKYPLNMLDPGFWNQVTWITVGLSVFFMIVAVIGIWKKDVPENYNGFATAKVKLRDFITIMKHNKAIQMLIIAASTDKLAFSMQGAITVYFYANVLMNQNIQSVMSLISIPVSIIFIIIGTIIGKRVTQRKAFVAITWVGLITSALGILFFPKVGAEISSINLIIFLFIFTMRSGAATVTGGFVTSMISDCADYEMYLTGRAVPGMMGTLFSFVDKLVSSMNGLVISLMFGIFALQNTVIEPLTPATNYEGLTMIIIVGLFVMPILGYVASVISMKYYPLNKTKMDEVKETIALYKERDADERAERPVIEK
ncbi:MAG: MFS transporter [Anaerorhabdus sp.]